MSRGLRVLADAATLADAAADAVAGWLSAAIERRGGATIALAGGSTPLALYRRLATRPELPWSRLEVFWGDERCVPPDHPESNYGRARQALLDHVAIPAEQVHRIRGEDPPAAAAERYAETLAALAPRLDVALLGLGEDGHTASLFPGTAALAERRRLVVANWVPRLGTWRVTLTLPALNAARQVLFLVAGSDKAAALAATLEARAPETPARRIQPEDGEVLWFVDRTAAALLGSPGL